jgi:hypothetical protein
MIDEKQSIISSEIDTIEMQAPDTVPSLYSLGTA